MFGMRRGTYGFNVAPWSLMRKLLRIFMGLMLLGISQGEAQSQPASTYLGTEKKGFGVVTQPDQSRQLEALKVRWFYTWGVGSSKDIPAGIEFIPMIWGWRDGPAQDRLFEDLTAKSRSGTLHTLLGFNEPDGKDQANLPVDLALEKWPQLVATGLRLGSPACVHPDGPWMSDFMAAVKKRNLRVDFVTVHWYGEPNAAEFLSLLDRVYHLYDRPIWITEFAPADWHAGLGRPNRFSKEQVEAFMRDVVPALMKLPYVERFAWFSSSPDSPELGISALFDAKGELTPLGRLYSGY